MSGTAKANQKPETPLTQEEINAASSGTTGEWSATLEEVSRSLQDDNFRDFFQTFLALFAYAGFDPEAVFKALIACAMREKLSRDDFLLDIVKLISYYVARGTTINRRGQVNSGTVEAQKEIEKLRKRYRIQDNISDQARAQNVVTMNRVMNTFPDVVGTLFSKNAKRPIGALGIIPRCIMFPGGAAMIPADKAWDPLFEKFLDWSVTFDRTINRLKRQANTKAFDEEESRRNQASWSELARTQGRHSDFYRATWLMLNAIDYEMGINLNKNTKTATYDHSKYKSKINYAGDNNNNNNNQ